MPLYNFVNNETGEHYEEYLYISELDDYLKTHPQVSQTLSAPAIISGRSWKPSNGFNDVLKKVANAYPRSNVHTF